MDKKNKMISLKDLEKEYNKKTKEYLIQELIVRRVTHEILDLYLEKNHIIAEDFKKYTDTYLSKL
jgi:hypothetical protein